MCITQSDTSTDNVNLHRPYVNKRKKSMNKVKKQLNIGKLL